MIIDCPNCHFEQPFESEFCPNCGKRIKPLLEQQKKYQSKQGTKSRLTLLAFSFLLFMGYIGFFYIQSYLNSQKSNEGLQLTRLQKINLQPKRFAIRKDTTSNSVKIATLNKGEDKEVKKTVEKKVQALAKKPTAVTTASTEYNETPLTRELESILLIDLYDCDLKTSVPSIVSADKWDDFSQCGQVLIEDMPFTGDPFLIEETRNHSIVGQILRSPNLIQLEVMLKLAEDEEYSFQSSYSFKLKDKSTVGLSYQFKPFKLKEESYNALSNSAFAPILFKSGDKTRLKGEQTFLYIFLKFK